MLPGCGNVEPITCMFRVQFLIPTYYVFFSAKPGAIEDFTIFTSRTRVLISMVHHTTRLKNRPLHRANAIFTGTIGPFPVTSELEQNSRQFWGFFQNMHLMHIGWEDLLPERIEYI